jgi:Holliday junction resolvase RusA-like endonuclease
MKIVVYGQAAPQGSKRHVGKGIMIESSKKVAPWRESVRWAAIAARKGQPAIDAPIIARMVFTFARPKGHYRTGKNAGQLRPNAPIAPATTPDLSKLLRSTEDALTSAGVWRDDARVAEYERAAKVFVGEDPEALDAPGVLIVIRVLERAA